MLREIFETSEGAQARQLSNDGITVIREAISDDISLIEPSDTSGREKLSCTNEVSEGGGRINGRVN
jgi:hypothetical protein